MKREPKKAISIRIDRDVFDFFRKKAEGKGHIVMMQDVLREYVDKILKAKLEEATMIKGVEIIEVEPGTLIEREGEESRMVTDTMSVIDGNTLYVTPKVLVALKEKVK